LTIHHGRAFCNGDYCHPRFQESCPLLIRIPGGLRTEPIRRCSETVKADLRRRMTAPARQSVTQISRELGIHIATLLWFADYVDWYNRRHRRSGIKFVIPHQRYNGEARKVCEHRERVYEQVRELHIKRWRRSTRCWRQPDVVWLNPPSQASDHESATLVLAG